MLEIVRTSNSNPCANLGTQFDDGRLRERGYHRKALDSILDSILDCIQYRICLHVVDWCNQASED